MVTRDILYLPIDTFLDIVVKSNFLLLSVGWYLFRVVTGNRYLPRGSNENTLCINSTGKVSVARRVIPLVTILLLDLVMIHWIRWIQGKSFGENSIVNFILLVKKLDWLSKINILLLATTLPRFCISKLVHLGWEKEGMFYSLDAFCFLPNKQFGNRWYEQQFLPDKVSTSIE